MRPTAAVAALALWAGATLLLAELRWFAAVSMVDRIRPYLPGGWQRRSERSGPFSVATFRDIVAPLARSAGDRLARVVGIHDDLETRLARTHSRLDPTDARLRQLACAGGAFGLGGLLTIAMALPVPVGLLVALGAPTLAFLVVEQRLTSASDEWQQRLFLELPVVSEQIGMLLSAGFSLGTALDRIAVRGTGACAQDLRRVGQRVRQGLTLGQALREWAELADVPAVTHLVSVLALDRDTGDLSRLIAEEARALRREAQRRLAADIDRRAQQVWIPVTVATLVPGTIFLAVPFLQALRLFSGN